jgi:starch-binding outer membrane protein SusE/F
MKKLSLYISIALAGLLMGSCSEDFKDWADPQTNPQEDAITIPGFTATAAQAIDFANVTTDSVNTFSLSSAALPEGFTLANARLELTPQGVENATKTTINTDLNGKGAVADLAPVVESAYGKRPTARTFDAQVYVNAVKDGQAVLIDAGKINLVMTPKAPFIDTNYYLVGQMTDWSLNTKFKFTHSDADVYEDPVFTIMFTTTDDNQYWKIIPQGNVDAGNIWAVENNPKGVVGVEKDGDDAMSGTLLTTTSKGEKANAGKLAKAGTYQMTINMMDYTYSIKQIAPEYYLVGALQSWSDQNMSCLMTAETAMVQNFTTKWTGDANLKIWLGSDFGKWDNAFGSASGDGVSAAEGKLKANGGAIVCPEKNAYYTFTADFSTMTYKWTKLANQNPTEFKYVSLIGVGGKWNEGDDIDLKQVAPHNWYLAKQEIPAGGLKIRADHKWRDDGNWGFAEGQKYESKGTLITSGGSGNIPVPAGTYNIYFNDITGAYAFVGVK